MRANRLTILMLVALLLPVSTTAAATSRPSALDGHLFKRYWMVESEAPDYRIQFFGDTCEILAPKGLTLWRREQLKGDVTVEYDAMVCDEGKAGDRLSDMNCFWMASDPQRRDIWQRAKWRNGIFTRCYTLQMYYLGYGGNHNTTTRFRRYNGDGRGVDSIGYRPAILREYTDSAHLLKPNHWYHIKIESRNGHNRFYIDDELLMDYFDPTPLTSGWFGFRTTLSRTRITNFSCYELASPNATTGIPLHWVGEMPTVTVPVTFGVPFAPGELREVNSTETVDAWVNARWPDGSVKWAGIASVVQPQDFLTLKLQGKKTTGQHAMDVRTTDTQIIVNTGRLQAYVARQGRNVIDSMMLDGTRVGGSAWLMAADGSGDYVSRVDCAVVERSGNVSAVVRINGHHQAANGRQWLPFTLRLYLWKGAEQIKIVHTFIYDGDAERDQLSALGLVFGVPLTDSLQQRQVAFATADGGVWAEAVRPLDSRSLLRGMPGDERIISQLAAWDGYRLSQLTDNSFAIRKRATTRSPWIGTFTGTRAPGYAYVGDSHGGMAIGMKDFWQAYPSTLQIDCARSSEARLTAWLWSPEAEPMNLCHYDTIAHGLQASYEDVQPGMSTPYGIGRTSTLWLMPAASQPTRSDIAACARRLTNDARLMPTPEYLYNKRAFGLWSLKPDKEDDEDATEQRLTQYLDYYLKAIEQHKWYGFWNYGDFMHAYNPERHTWRYDVGGYAWDNTELATPMWLWYSFLRTGRADVFRMAEAMTRHNSEVDTYHLGPWAPLGSRHNVSHWGCGAKEARISQAAFLRFYYYLTCDERTGDLMHAQTDADTLLLHLDPMRLAEPRELYPCSAPARLRIGPDWLAYAGNWMTAWERTTNTYYRDKLLTGMESIAALPNGLFTGNKALGYDPTTGRISYDGNANRMNTNHLMTIMGGFEVMSELLLQPSLISIPKAFRDVWLDHALRYKQMARDISHNHFAVRRLMAYGAWQTNNTVLAAEAWNDLWHRVEHTEAPPVTINHVDPPLVPAPVDEWLGLSTNDAALWSLDAIYMKEVIPY